MEKLAVTKYEWEKRAFLLGVDFILPGWGLSHALVPTPVVQDENNVRIFASFLDSNSIGRIGWVDLFYDGVNFTIKAVSQEPFLNVGPEGSFSEYGTGLGCFWPRENPEILSFIGFSRPPGFKFKAFSGIEPLSNIDSFSKSATEKTWLKGDYFGKTIVGVHDLIEIDGVIYGFVSLGNDFEIIQGKPYPKYQVGLFSGRTLEKLDLVAPNILPLPENVYRMGRPRVELTDWGVEIIVTAGTTDGRYFPIVFYSNDLKKWKMCELNSFSANSIRGFDDKQQCYLSRFSIQDKDFIVYNGNEMGRYGFGIATSKYQS
jgi:hypothetical protein